MSEIRDQVMGIFPVLDWLQDGYRVNSHTIDSLLFASYCHPEIFRGFGYSLPEPKTVKKTKKDYVYAT